MQIKLIAAGSSWWERFIRRWGVSFLINEDILFDAFGDPGVFLRSAAKYNIDLSKIRHIVISHDDWDHISGLWNVLERNKKVTVYICPNFSQETKARISSCGVNVVEVRDFQEIIEGIYTTGEMQADSEGRIIYEQALVLKRAEGLAIITGCAHPGIIKVVEKAKSRFSEKIYLLIGGMHLKDSSRKEIAEVVSKIKDDVEKVAPMHCTGRYATRLMLEEFKDNFIRIKPGGIVNI